MLIPSNFTVPQELNDGYFKLRMLKVSDVVKDYDAVMSSLNYLKGIFGPNHRWPYEELTLEQDLIDLGWHQKEFQRKTSFAYTVMNQDESQCLGCFYIFPSTKNKYDVEVYFWVRESIKNKDSKLYKLVKTWVKNEWPFKKVTFPGREIPWAEWKTL